MSSYSKSYLPVVFFAFRNTIITSVVPGDYDGDSQMDVLLTAQTSPTATTVYIVWGDNQTLGTAYVWNELVLQLCFPYSVITVSSSIVSHT